MFSLATGEPNICHVKDAVVDLLVLRACHPSSRINGEIIQNLEHNLCWQSRQVSDEGGFSMERLR